MRAIRKKSLMRSLLTAVFLLIFGVLFIVFGPPGSSAPDSDQVNILVLVIILPAVLFALVVGIYRGRKRQLQLMQSYTLTLTSNLITREQLNTATITFYANEIKSIHKHSTGGFTVKGRGSGDTIIIPPLMERSSDLEALLAHFSRLDVVDRRSLLQRILPYAGFVSGALMLCVAVVENKVVLIISGTLLVAILSWSFIKFRDDKNIDAKTKRLSGWMLFVLSAILVSLIFKLIK